MNLYLKIRNHQRMVCAKFSGNWPSGSGEEDFLKSRQCIFAISCHLPLGKGVVLHLNKLESPLLKNALCQVRFKWVLGKKDFNILSSYLSLEKN